MDNKSLPITDHETEASVGKKSIGYRTYILYFIILLFIGGSSILLYLNRDVLVQLERFGYAGIFLISFIINSTLIMPMPTGVLTSAFGAVYNPLLVGLFAGSGSALGESFGYLAGYSGRKVLERGGKENSVMESVKKYGSFGVLLLAFLPNPAFDLVGIAAGALRIPFARFLFFCWIGKCLKMIVFAYLGDLLNFGN